MAQHADDFQLSFNNDFRERRLRQVVGMDLAFDDAAHLPVLFKNNLELEGILVRLMAPGIAGQRPLRHIANINGSQRDAT